MRFAIPSVSLTAFTNNPIKRFKKAIFWWLYCPPKVLSISSLSLRNDSVKSSAFIPFALSICTRLSLSSTLLILFSHSLRICSLTKANSRSGSARAENTAFNPPSSPSPRLAKIDSINSLFCMISSTFGVTFSGICAFIPLSPFWFILLKLIL